MEEESTWIELEKTYQLAESVSYQVSIIVEPPAIVKNIVSSFDWI